MLYIIRHGKTDWNVEHRLQGQTDTELNEEGRRMAREAATEYANIHFDVCYCSPLLRARETAKILLDGRDIPIIYDDRLKEMGFGEFEGLKECFSIPDCPVNVFFKDPANYTDPQGGAESMDSLFSRTGDFLEEIEPELEAGKDILIVGHGAMNSSIICRIKYNLDRKRFWDEGIPNCRLMRLM